MTDHHLTLEEMKQRGAKRGFEDDEGNLYFDDEAAWKEQEHVFADFVDGDGPFFASRGIHPAVRQARQYRYWDLEHAELVVEAWRRYMKMRRLAGKLVDNPHQLAQVRRWAEQ